MSAALGHVMSIAKFLENLLPTFKRDRVLSDLAATKDEIVRMLPVYKEAANTMKSWSFKSAMVKPKVQIFKQQLSGRDSDNPVAHIAKHLDMILANLTTVEKLAEDILADNIAATGMTYKQAVLLKYVDTASFVVKYARRFLYFVFAYESAEFKNNSINPDESVTKAERAWIDKNILDFCRAYASMIGEPGKTLESFNTIPEIEVSRSDERVVSSNYGTKADPFKFGFLASNYNPIYWLRTNIAEWMHGRHVAAKEELTSLELRRLQLEKLMKNQPDAKLEAQIAYMENRIQRLQDEIRETEKTYG